MKQILLKGRDCSGRGVRLELLTPAQISRIREETAKEINSETTMIAWEDRQTELGVAAMVVAVTEKAGLATKDDLLAAKWKKLSAEEVREKGPEYFTPKDICALQEIYKRLHKVSDKEVDDILGEALDVTAD